MKGVGAWLAGLALAGTLLGRPAELVFYYHADHLGSVRMITDGRGEPVAVRDYLPFGEVVVATGEAGRTFTGQPHDGETGRAAFPARYYAAPLGRWLSPDALFADQQPADPQSWNRYGYVGNNPVRFIDPTGRVKQRRRRERDLRQDRSWHRPFCAKQLLRGRADANHHLAGGLRVHLS